MIRKAQISHPIIINILLCVASVTIFLGGAEALARIKYSPQKIQSNGMFEYDKKKIFKLKKNFAWSYYEGDFTTNSHGFRGKEINLKKSENTKRVLVVGDSISFGHGVNNDQTYSFYLENALNKHFADKNEEISIEVINTAAPGNSPLQEYYDLKRGLAFEPDVIVLQFTLNDIIEHNSKWILQTIGMEEGALETVSHDYILGFNNFPTIDYALRQSSALYLFIKDLSARIRFKSIDGKDFKEKAIREENYNVGLMITDPNNPIVVKSWESALNWHKAMTDIAKEKNIPFILLATPFGFQLEMKQEMARPQQILKEFAAEEDIYYLDLLEILRDLLTDKVDSNKTHNQLVAETRKSDSKVIKDFWNIFFIDIDHPSPIGNELISGALKPIVLDALHLTTE